MVVNFSMIVFKQSFLCHVWKLPIVLVRLFCKYNSLYFHQVRLSSAKV